MYLPVTDTGLVPATASGDPAVVEKLPEGVGKPEIVDIGTLHVFACPEAIAQRMGKLQPAPFFASNSLVMQAIALIRNRLEQRFDPRTGHPLDYPPPGTIGRDPQDSRRMVFPRLDPAVIGLIELKGEEKILLARNRRRNGFFSLIAGYVEPGETIEAALARETMEETGRRIENLRYWGSQPWPPSSSLMLGLYAETSDVQTTRPTDGELEEIRWVTRAELPKLPLATAGSIAHAMIMEWYHGE